MNAGSFPIRRPQHEPLVHNGTTEESDALMAPVSSSVVRLPSLSSQPPVQWPPSCSINGGSAEAPQGPSQERDGGGRLLLQEGLVPSSKSQVTKLLPSHLKTEGERERRGERKTVDSSSTSLLLSRCPPLSSSLPAKLMCEVPICCGGLPGKRYNIETACSLKTFVCVCERERERERERN
ncbi:unnamed protein product [Musa acuminata subsp. burmannicoides]